MAKYDYSSDFTVYCGLIVWLVMWRLMCQVFVVTGKSVSLDQKTNIVVPQDRDGLYAIDVLDPDMVCFVSGLLCQSS